MITTYHPNSPDLIIIQREGKMNCFPTVLDSLLLKTQCQWLVLIFGIRFLQTLKILHPAIPSSQIIKNFSYHFIQITNLKSLSLPKHS